MHDRTVDGLVLTFGNQGALFMKAMTWWDHSTGSIWSQPWGAAISGDLLGTALPLIPSTTVPWETWLADHPDTTVLADLLNGRRREITLNRSAIVIGVALGEDASAYPFDIAAAERVLNDRVGEFPIAVFSDSESLNIQVYLRRPIADSTDDAVPAEIEFVVDTDGRATDSETGSVWDITRGVAIDGPLKGAVLQQVPYVTAFPWAWRDFFPYSTFYGDEG